MLAPLCLTKIRVVRILNNSSQYCPERSLVRSLGLIPRARLVSDILGGLISYVVLLLVCIYLGQKGFSGVKGQLRLHIATSTRKAM